jgi:hypothetical protein
MAITVEAVYENGNLKLSQPLPLEEHERVQVTVQRLAEIPPAIVLDRRGPGPVPWTGSLEDLDYLIEDADNDPLEGP